MLYVLGATDEGGSYFGHDGISVGSHCAHAGGYPIVSATHQWQGIGSNSIEKTICLPKRILRVVAGVLPTVPRFLTSDAVGVGNPPKPRPDVRCADAASWQIRRCCGVACALQVSANMVEPSEAISTCNLFAKDCARAALSDEAEERRP